MDAVTCGLEEYAEDHFLEFDVRMQSLISKTTTVHGSCMLDEYLNGNVKCGNIQRKLGGG